MPSLVRCLLGEGRRHARGRLPWLTLIVHVGQVRWLAAATSRATRVPIDAALVTPVMQCATSRTDSRIGATLAVFLVLERTAFRLRDVRSKLRRNVSLVHRGLRGVNIPLILLHDLARRLYVA